MKTAIIIFISVSLSLDFISSLISTHEDGKNTSYINCLWSALMVFAWGYIGRFYL